ncbi:hypothetical protein [Xenorhabdus bovienii]|uniref:hypothetical protein n=1 Tax=Xenorhabdus bovienii TaxID=40576 RepID=UPI003DA2FCAE
MMENRIEELEKRAVELEKQLAELQGAVNHYRTIHQVEVGINCKNFRVTTTDLDDRS